MEVIQEVLKLSGISNLNPVQELAVKAGLLENKNMVVAAPTASGKTLIAELAALSTIKKGKKAIYIVPLRALASEKYEDFKAKYNPLGTRVALSMGDLDSSDKWLSGFDLIIITSEKFDSLLRHGINWLDEIGLVIADEIHLLDSPDRGPNLEVLLTRLRQYVKPQILALSATIKNYDELADWLGAEAVKSDYRPVRLFRGVCFDGSVDFQPKKKLSLDSEKPQLISILDDTVKKEKQCLLFVSTRRSAESTAEKLGSHVEDLLKPEEAKKLSFLSNQIEHSLESPTRQCKRLAGCVKKGTAFHHAGLVNAQRRLIEEGFKTGLIKAISATPTLAAGINLPAYRVVIRDMKRFSSYKGMSWIPVLEIEQMMGRAGRPKYDSEGQAILLAKDENEAKYTWDNYIMGETEKIYSKLGMEPVLRMHILALISSEVTRTKKELFDFFAKTFYAWQYKDMGELNKKLEKMLSLLTEFRFIQGSGAPKESSPFRPASELVTDGELKPTRIGKRVSELYIDPLTAHHLITSMEKIKQEKLKPNHFGLLHVIADSIEMFPLMNVRKKDFEWINDLVMEQEKHLVQKVPEAYDIEYDDFLRSIKTAGLLLTWAEESGEDEIMEKFSATPGELRARLERADWLLYSLQELSLLLNHMDVLKDIRKIRLRLKYGVKQELLPFVKLKNVGRSRARKIYSSGIKSVSELRKVPLQSLERLIGRKTAESVKKQLGEL